MMAAMWLDSQSEDLNIKGMDQFQSPEEPPQYQASSGSGSGSGSGAFNAMNKIHDDCKPSIILIFLGFKFGPILIYLLLKLATDQYLSTFILIALLVSFDFWVTKNIAGRQLAALRWYTKLNEDNEERWCFEASQVRVSSSCNSAIFWMGQFLPIVFWIIITLINIVTLSTFWVFLAIFCCVLLVCNFIFFLECKGEHQERVNSLTKRFGVQFFELNEQKQ